MNKTLIFVITILSSSIFQQDTIGDIAKFKKPSGAVRITQNEISSLPLGKNLGRFKGMQHIYKIDNIILGLQSVSAMDGKSLEEIQEHAHGEMEERLAVHMEDKIIKVSKMKYLITTWNKKGVYSISFLSSLVKKYRISGVVVSSEADTVKAREAVGELLRSMNFKKN